MAIRKHPWDATADAKAAQTAGWRLDRDLFYWRRRRSGDIVIPEGHAYFGFTTEETPKNDRVFVRSAAYALAFDRGVVAPYNPDLSVAELEETAVGPKP
ncbi:hypothetical protein ACVIGB_000629 [Bradyrhizobium sp. USDA 4341]